MEFAMIKRILRSAIKFLPIRFQNEIIFIKNKNLRERIIEEWRKKGQPIPPPHQVKQVTIEYYQKKYNCNTLVETGTYLGDMVLMQKENFSKIYSIELSTELWKRAVDKFSAYPHIEILQGDSSKVLHQVVPLLTSCAVFWLDGHYSAGVTAKGEKLCPIYEELDAIFKGKALGHILLIDDARAFNGQGDYPTLDALEQYVKSKDELYQMSVKDDIIRFVKIS